MPVRFQHDQQPTTIYFVTFTCYKWLSLIQETNTYDGVYKWFDSLYSHNIYVTGYVIMPNHVHALLYFPEMPKSLNTVIGNAKRFLAYEIVKRLEEMKANSLLDTLHAGVKKRERKKGQIHKVFEDSFDAKECHSTKFILQNLSTCITTRLVKDGNLQMTLRIMNIPVHHFMKREQKSMKTLYT